MPRFRAATSRRERKSDGPLARFAIVQGVVPAYRTPLFLALRSELGQQLAVVSGQAHFEQSVTSDRSVNVVDVGLSNVFMFGRRLLYQRGYRRATTGTDTIVLELNPRVINTWLSLIESRITGRRTVLWGHHLGRRAGETRPRLVRRVHVGLCTALLAYTDDDAISMRATYPGKDVFVAPNATERKRDSALAIDRRRTDFLFVGRLTDGKRPGLLLSGFAAALRNGLLPSAARLLFVGEGPLKASLEREAERLALGNRVVFVAGTFDSALLNDLYASTVAGVCGGYVGLNITQSLSRGVPFVYPTAANHSPEISLARPGFNAFPFDPSDAAGTAAALGEAWSANEQELIDHNAIREAVVSRYSIESMVSGFLEALQIQR